MASMSMRYLREPRGKRKQWVYQRTIPPELQAYDRGKSGQPRKQIEIGLGRDLPPENWSRLNERVRLI
jgi:hypothetical protein